MMEFPLSINSFLSIHSSPRHTSVIMSSVRLFLLFGVLASVYGKAQLPPSMFGPSHPMFNWGAPQPPMQQPQPFQFQGPQQPQPPPFPSAPAAPPIPSAPSPDSPSVSNPSGTADSSNVASQGQGYAAAAAAAMPADASRGISGAPSGPGSRSNTGFFGDGIGSSMNFKNFSSATFSGSNTSRSFNEKTSSVQEIENDGSLGASKTVSQKAMEESSSNRDFDKFDGLKLKKVNNGSAISENKEVLGEESRAQSDSKSGDGEYLEVIKPKAGAIPESVGDKASESKDQSTSRSVDDKTSEAKGRSISGSVDDTASKPKGSDSETEKPDTKSEVKPEEKPADEPKAEPKPETVNQYYGQGSDKDGKSPPGEEKKEESKA